MTGESVPRTETMTEQTTSGRAIASLVFGILGLVGFVPCVGPILAIVLGSGEADGVAKAGVLLGWITLALYSITVFVVLLLAVIFGGWGMFS